MDESPSGRSWTPRAVVVVVIVIGILVAMLFPAVCYLREVARRAACLNNMKQLGIALHNFHDAHKKFPGSNDVRLLDEPSDSWAGVPLHTPAEPDPSVGRARYGTNYSWLSRIQFYLEEVNVVQWMPDMVNGRAWDVCSDNPVDPKTGFGKDPLRPCNPMYWRAPITYFRCPSFGAQQFCEANPKVGITTNPYDPKTPYGPAALTNYVALGATHSDSLMGAETDPLAGGASHPNGVIYPASRTSLDDIADGSTNTFIACETRETTLAAWWEGSTAAVFGLLGKPAFVSKTSSDGKTFGSPAEGVKTTLNYGNEEAKPVQYYLPAGPQSVPWLHGPSSNHPGLVNHLVADGSVRSVQEEIDPKTYMHLITREGGESVAEYFQ